MGGQPASERRKQGVQQACSNQLRLPKLQDGQAKKDKNEIFMQQGQERVQK